MSGSMALASKKPRPPSMTPLSVTIPDFAHSVDEQRFLLLGLSIRRRLLVVAHSERGESIRIISARRANRRERRIYEEDQ